MTILFYFGMPYILKVLNTPSQIIKEALSYIQIIALFITITLLYNYSAGLLRAIGDSKTPLYILCVASILNVILDIICITKFSLGVKGSYRNCNCTIFCKCFMHYFYFKKTSNFNT